MLACVGNPFPGFITAVGSARRRGGECNDAPGRCGEPPRVLSAPGRELEADLRWHRRGLAGVVMENGSQI